MTSSAGLTNWLFPFDGSATVGIDGISQKAVVSANKPLVTVVDLGAFEVEVKIPEAYADDLGLGMQTEVQYNAVTYPGELTSLYSGSHKQRSRRPRSDFIEGNGPPGLRQNQRVTARVVMGPNWIMS